MPTGERGQRICDLAAIDPQFPLPAVLLGHRHEVDQLPRRYIVMNEMAVWAHPDLCRRFQIEMSQAIGRHQTAISDAAGKARLLRTEQSVAHDRVNSVRANQDVGGDRCTVFKMCLDPVAVINQMGETVAEMNAVHRDSRRDRAMQVAAMQRVVGCVESGFDGFPQWRAEQIAAIVPAPLVKGLRPHPVAGELCGNSEAMENA